MNNPTSNKESSNPSKSIKQSDGVEAQLAHRKKAQSGAVSETVTTPALATELIPASALPPVEKASQVQRSGAHIAFQNDYGTVIE